MNAFKYNKDAKYSVNGYNPKTIEISTLVVAVDDSKTFQTKISDPLKKYLNPPIKSDSIVTNWVKNPILFYQNQLNFAVYCATTGCGVSYANHLNHPDLLTKSVYRLHVYYQIRRILSEIQAPVPNDDSYNPFNNRIDKKAYERICNEFGIDVKTDFRQNLDRNHGLGTLYYKYSHRAYEYDYWPGHTSFLPNSQVHIGSIEQKHSNAWTTFILDEGRGFTRAGIERINESIRTYAWCVLGSQAEVRSGILDPSTGFDTQKQFLANLEDAVHSAVDLPSSIKRYQDVLRYARSKVDFVVGIGLYLLPSNMQLQIGLIKNYNNTILIAGEGQNMGKNKDLNDNPTRLHKEAPREAAAREAPAAAAVAEVQPAAVEPKSSSHDEQKTALVLGLTVAGLAYLYFFK